MYDIDDELMDDPMFTYVVASPEDFENQEDEKAYKQYLQDAIKEIENK